MSGARPVARKKAVVVLDDGGRQGTLFDPFAATLRRRGLSPIRLTFEPPDAARAVRDRLFYTRVLRLDGRRPLEELARLFAAYDVVDVQLGEASLARLGLTSEITVALAGAALSCSRRPPCVLFDKFELNALLAAAGLPVPPQLPASIGLEAAVERLGLPLVIKQRTAEGGRGVHIAESLAAARRLLSAWDRPSEDLFFQRYIPGDLVMYGVLADGAGPLLEGSFQAVRFQKTWGPCAQVNMRHDPQLSRVGQDIVALLGLRGLAQFDFIRDRQGRIWHIDANPRCWGSMLGASAAGADFISAYARMVGAPRRSPAKRPPTQNEFVVQPYGLLAAAASGSLRRLALAWPGFARFCRSGPGPAYAGLLASKAVATAARRWRQPQA